MSNVGFGVFAAVVDVQIGMRWGPTNTVYDGETLRSRGERSGWGLSRGVVADSVMQTWPQLRAPSLVSMVILLHQDGDFSTAWTCSAGDCELRFSLFNYRHIKQVKIGELIVLSCRTPLAKPCHRFDDESALAAADGAGRTLA